MKSLLRLLCALMALCLAAGSVAYAGNEQVDFGGRTLKVAIWYEPEIPTLGNSDSEDAWYYSLKHACEQYNCKVEWIVNTQETHFNKFIQMSLSGEVYADIMMCHSWNYVSLIQQGLILPTTEYIASAPDSEYWNMTTSSLFGETWGIEAKNIFLRSIPCDVTVNGDAVDPRNRPAMPSVCLGSAINLDTGDSDAPEA